MPDQSSASTEHAILQEITAPLATLPDDPVPLAADPDFPVALRGYDRLAVDAYVKKTSQLVAELQATRSPEAAIRRALERVGEQISGVLKRAHETAEQITAQSRREAEERLEVARREASEIIARAEGRVKELDADTDRIWAERHRIVDDTRSLAQELLGIAEAAVAQFPAADDTDDDLARPEARDAPEEEVPEVFTNDPPPPAPDTHGAHRDPAIGDAEAAIPALSGEPAPPPAFSGEPPPPPAPQTAPAPETAPPIPPHPTDPDAGVPPEAVEDSDRPADPGTPDVDVTAVMPRADRDQRRDDDSVR